MRNKRDYEKFLFLRLVEKKANEFIKIHGKEFLKEYKMFTMFIFQENAQERKK